MRAIIDRISYDTIKIEISIFLHDKDILRGKNIKNDRYFASIEESIRNLWCRNKLKLKER